MQLAALGSFDDLRYAEEIVYVGPDKLGDEWAAPKDYKQPYTFEHVTAGGTLTCETRYGGRQYLVPEHPANDPQHWRRRAVVDIVWDCRDCGFIGTWLTTPDGGCPECGSDNVATRESGR